MLSTPATTYFVIIGWWHSYYQAYASHHESKLHYHLLLLITTTLLDTVMCSCVSCSAQEIHLNSAIILRWKHQFGHSLSNVSLTIAAKSGNLIAWKIIDSIKENMNSTLSFHRSKLQSIPSFSHFAFSPIWDSFTRVSSYVVWNK